MLKINQENKRKIKNIETTTLHNLKKHVFTSILIYYENVSDTPLYIIIEYTLYNGLKYEYQSDTSVYALFNMFKNMNKRVIHLCILYQIYSIYIIII